MEQNSTDGWLTRQIFDEMMAEDDEEDLLSNPSRCLTCDMLDDHSTDECPYGDGSEPESCDGCGEQRDVHRPNAGDGWAEMAGPGYEDEHFTGHLQCGQARGLELA